MRVSYRSCARAGCREGARFAQPRATSWETGPHRGAPSGPTGPRVALRPERNDWPVGPASGLFIPDTQGVARGLR